MNYFVKLSLIIIANLFIINNLFSQKMTMIDKIDDLTLGNKGQTYIVGDTLIFMGNLINQDTSIINTRLFFYYDNKFQPHYFSEFISKVFGPYNFIVSFHKYENGDFLFAFENGGLYKYSKGKFSNFDSLFTDNKLSTVNGLASRKNGEFYLQSNYKLFKFDGKDVEILFDDPSDYNIIPHFYSFNSIFFLKDKLIFRNYFSRFSNYNFETGKVSDFKDFDDWLKNPSYYNLGAMKLINEELYFIYHSEGKYHFAKYDGSTFTNLDNYLELIPLADGYDFFIDKQKNIYFRTNYKAPKSTDSLYVIDKNLNVKNILYHHLVKSLLQISGIFEMSNGDIYITADNMGLLKIHSPTSVESPTNLLFMNKLYPNPARNKINIDFGVEPINLNNTKVEIYDYLGRSAVELNPELNYDSGTGRGTFTCDISNLRSGYYITVLTNGKYTRSMPLFVK